MKLPWLHTASRFVVDELGSDLIVTGLYRHELPRLPEVVVRETIANAVAHRTYELDRAAVLVEIRPDVVVNRSLGPKDRLLLVHAARGESLTNGSARSILGTEDRVLAREALHRLRDAGLLEQHGERGGAAYTLTDTVAPPAAFRLSPRELGEMVVEAATKEPLSNARVRSLTGLDRQAALSLLQSLVRSRRLRQNGQRRGTTYIALKRN